MQPISCVFLLLCAAFVACRPPPAYHADAPPEDDTPAFAIAGLEELEYGRYIQEVVNELDRDPNFRRVIESDNYTRAEDIASQLSFLSHSVRTRLDELKRVEVDRLVALQRTLDSLKKVDKRGKQQANLLRVAMRHIDINNPQTFNEADLVRLIRQTAADLERLDDYRREQFKRYEMRKTLERIKAYKTQMAAAGASVKPLGQDKAAAEAAMNFGGAQMRPQPPNVRLNYPGRRTHLVDVWNYVDGQEGPFSERTFFALHDTNTDGYLDLNEVNALMRRELEKLYPSAALAAVDKKPGDVDANERYEEMNRMREAIFKQVDANNDAMISLEEFLAWTRNPLFSRDEVWKTLVEMPPTFTSAEFEQFMLEEEQQHPDVQPAEHNAQPAEAPGLDLLGNAEVPSEDPELPVIAPRLPLGRQDDRAAQITDKQEQLPEQVEIVEVEQLPDPVPL